MYSSSEKKSPHNKGRRVPLWVALLRQQTRVCDRCLRKNATDEQPLCRANPEAGGISDADWCLLMRGVVGHGLNCSGMLRACIKCRAWAETMDPLSRVT